MKVKFDTYIRENIKNEEYDSIMDDYGIKKNIPIELTNISNKAISQFKEDIDLFDSIEVIFVKNIGELGKFRSGTASSTPIVLLSDTNIIKASKKYKVSIKTTIETTIYHELGHAICELEYECFDNQFLDYDDEEEWVEDFAYDYFNYGTIPEELEEFIENKKSKY